MSLALAGKLATARWSALLLAATALLTSALLAPALAQASTGPVLAGSVSDATTLPTVDSVAVAGSYAYVTDYYAGRLSAIDISLPSSPFIAGSSASSSGLMNGSTVNIAGGYAFVASKNRNGPEGSESNDDGTGNSLTILDIHTNPAEPQIVGTVHDADSLFGAYGIAVSGNYAYTASQGCITEQPCPNTAVGHSVDVIELTGPEAPKIVATLRNGAEPQAYGHITSVAISGHYAYLTAAYQDRLSVVDIANPLSPKLVASLHDTTNLQFPVDVAISGHYAYVICQLGKGPLTAVDISDPTKPTVVGSLSSPELSGGYRIRTRGAMAYVSASANEGIAVADISDPSNLRLLASYTDSSHLHSTTGLDLDESGEHVVATSTYLLGQKKATFPPYPLEPGGPEQDGTVSVITLDPEPIKAAIGSGPAESTAQTSASFGFSVNDAVATVRCRLDGAPLALCATPTGQSYTNLSAGTHEFQVQTTDSSGTTDTAAYIWAITAAPANTEPPSISGNAINGETLTASPGAWSGYPAPTLTYQWQRCDQSGGNCAPIAKATSSTYTLTATDVGSTIRLTVQANNSAGTGKGETQPTAIVAASSTAPTNTKAPAVSGNAVQGETLTASPGSWSGYPTPTLTYQWQRCDKATANCAPILEATSTAYTLTATDAAFTIKVTVTATNSGGSTSATSPASAVVGAPPATTAAPNVSGNAIESQTLTASSGTWSAYPAPTFTYQWERCDSSGQGCVPIAGATQATYTTGSADLGSSLAVVVTATNPHGSSTAKSASTAVVTAPVLDGGAGGSGPGGGGSGGGGSLGSGIGGGGVLGTPGVAEVRAALVGALTPRGNAGRIASVAKHRGYQTSFDAPAGGQVTISWYELPKGARLAGAKPILVASGRASVTTKAALKLTVKLTTRGRSLLKRGHRIKLVARGSFTLTGGSPVTVVKPFTLL